MNAYISQVIYAFNGWDGIKHSIKMYETSNRLINAFVVKGLDSKLNPSTIKQLFQYNNTQYVKMLSQGFAFVYQGIDYTLTQKGSNLFITFDNPKGSTGGFTLTPTGIKAYAQRTNSLKDVIDVSNGLYDVLVK